MTQRLLYCHCAFAKTISDEVKSEVLRKLSASGVAFDAVPDLCEMSARRDPALARLVDQSGGDTRIAACFPRAVKWLFHAAGTPLPDSGVEVLNMREQSADEIVEAMLRPAGAGAEAGAEAGSAADADAAANVAGEVGR